MKVDLLPYLSIGQDLRDEMTALRNHCSIYDSPFFDPDFAAVLAKVRNDVFVITVQDAAGLAGFWPLHVRPGKWARPIGAAFSDWHGPVLREGFRDILPVNLLEKAGLKGMTAGGLQPHHMGACSGGEIMGAGLATTPDGGEAYRALMRSLHPKHFKNLRRAERLIAKDVGEMVLNIDDTSREAFDWLMSTKQEQYIRTGKHNVLGPPWVQDMMEALFTQRLPRLRGRLSTLRLGGKLAAAEFDLLSDKVVHGWITAYDHAYAGYSPGHLLMLSVIADMENTGHEVCDMGAGNHAYTKHYESYVRPSERVIIKTSGAFRPFASIWRAAETAMPGRAKTTMQSMRHRGDQIFNTELNSKDRLKGLAQALFRRR